METTFPDNKVTLNYKTQQTWNDETMKDNTWCKGPGETRVFRTTLENHFNDPYSNLDELFEIRIVLNKNMVIIYDHQSYQFDFYRNYDITEIKSLQVWDDVENISECIFKYKYEK